jgi:hypothetical protein
MSDFRDPKDVTAPVGAGEPIRSAVVTMRHVLREAGGTKAFTAETQRAARRTKSARYSHYLIVLDLDILITIW